jgi:hypothetical protein
VAAVPSGLSLTPLRINGLSRSGQVHNVKHDLKMSLTGCVIRKRGKRKGKKVKVKLSLCLTN